VGLEPTTKGL